MVRFLNLAGRAARIGSLVASVVLVVSDIASFVGGRNNPDSTKPADDPKPEA